MLGVGPCLPSQPGLRHHLEAVVVRASWIPSHNYLPLFDYLTTAIRRRSWIEPRTRPALRRRRNHDPNRGYDRIESTISLQIT